ncbi:hypothetical protein K502DRAFT_351528 [Neoconidiobolus thromboides FSU 785]|nr:hypothetical protein K502DRAFT_351528 [Neoconidiobolus thromboides FSU 785]
MKDIFQYFNPDDKRGGFKVINKRNRNRYNEFYTKASEIEKIIKKLLQMKVDIEDESTNVKLQVCKLRNELYLPITEYVDWVLNQLNQVLQGQPSINLEKISKFQNQHILNFISRVKIITDLPNLPVQRRIMSYKFNNFDANFLEIGAQFYIKYLDPLGLWFTASQLNYELKKEKSDLKFAIILYISNFAVHSNKDSDLNQHRVHYYKYLKSKLHTYYINPSLNHIIIIMFLAFFEASLHRLAAFKSMLFTAVRMGQLLGYGELASSERNKHNFFDNFHTIREAKIWDLIILNCSALSSILGSAMIDCVPKIKNLSKISEEYKSSPFLLQLIKPDNISKLPIIKEAAANITFLCSNFNIINEYHAEWRMEFNKCSFKDIVRYYSSLKFRSFKEADLLLHEYRKKMSMNYSALELLTKDSKLIKWLGVHHFSKNWLTFGPVYTIIMSHLLIIYPKMMNMSAISGVDIIRCLHVIEPCHLFYFRKWYDYCSLNDFE